MVTCVRPSINNMLPMAPINPFVIGLTPSVAAAVAVSNHSTTTTAMMTTTATATATTTVTALTTNSTPIKPKLAFSIDAIVGGGNAGRNQQLHQRNATHQPALSPVSSSQRSDSPVDDFERTPQMLRFTAMNMTPPQHCQQTLELRNSFPVIYTRPIIGAQPATPNQRAASGLIYCRRPSSLDRECCSPNRSPVPLHERCRSRSPRSPPPPPHSPITPPPTHLSVRSRTPTPNRGTARTTPPTPTPTATSSPLPKATPILVPGMLPAGLIRPLPMQPPNLTSTSNNANIPPGSLAGSSPTALPSNVSGHPSQQQQQQQHHQPQQQPPPPPPPAPANPHFLAAQFQMAAALAHHHHQQQQQQQLQPHHHHHPPPHLAATHPMSIFPPGHPHHPHFGGPSLVRDSYPLYPWLLSRHGRIFPHRFPGFLLQPFRKPKRVRTAFSPTQLLKLEHAFEGNHYVVGAERKQLAQGLSLTETQVKVWFQNRRTKHKRMQQEGGDSDSKSNKGDNDGKNDSSQHSYSENEEDEHDENDEVDDLDHDDVDDEDEVIDMDDYGSEMDMEEQQRMREHFQQQASRELQQQQLQQQQHHQQLQQQHTHLLNLQQQQQQQQQQQHHQQFMQQQLYLQQQQQQQQQKQQQ